MLLSREDLIAPYPRITQDHKRDILREYLQHLFLKYLFTWPIAKHLIFIWGTALRIIHGLPRFSEDLDFDNTWWLSYETFVWGVDFLLRQLEMSNIYADVHYTQKIAYHANVKIKNILTYYNLAPDTREEVREKLPIKIDTHAQWLEYTPDLILLQAFGVNTLIQVAPVWVLMAMKIITIWERKKAKWRDYVDLKFLMDKWVKPHFGILEKLCNCSSGKQIITYLWALIDQQNKTSLIRDVQPFLFNPYDDSIEHFEKYITTYQRD